MEATSTAMMIVGAFACFAVLPTYESHKDRAIAYRTVLAGCVLILAGALLRDFTV